MGSMGCWPGGIASIGVETTAGRFAASHPDRGISTSDRPSKALRRPALLGLAPGTRRISMTFPSFLDAFIVHSRLVKTLKSQPFPLWLQGTAASVLGLISPAETQSDDALSRAQHY
ncbi:hypothetical protein PG997_009056 [Apiospora hydei]|uniref:Uncharacterized protein n=1 Tax=Apiospora hydei TaxID=1337664 RepID=A0ABR1VT39_9PEZI